MKLKELKALVAEEYNKFMYEQEDEEKDKKDDKEKDDAPKGGDDKGDDKPKAPKGGGDKGGDKPKAPKAPKVDVGPGDLDISGEENPEETLRAIYDMLKDFFEGDDEEAAPKAPKAPAGMDAEPMGAPMGGPGDMMALQERFKKLANIIK
tara:strand:- start:159 stop:608 length:450 start_codon:yes stop_codon:yes gene_type:complete